MELDSALNELGMLSIVTESRRDFLREKSATASAAAASSSPSSSFHVVKMNPQFVTCVGSVLSSSSHPITRRSSKGGGQMNGVMEAEKSLSASHGYPSSSALVSEHRVVRTHRPRCRYQRKPYSVPYRPKVSHSRKMKSYLSTSLEDDVFFDDPQTDYNGNGRKYRSPSTEAAEKAPSLSVPTISLPRSKSLDDLHLDRLRIDDGLSRHRSDVELASKLISNLQVS
ncbi:uncharacterized protein [Diadema setosum]|uniref:uncharacterized protein n=1 Tax=Diadema setosum TaxID=31175 RepID=UPI003B3A3FDF